ncbi:ATP-dependent zinc metalloprotease FtsH [Benzoatithermus flavus]|uniref:ATP-dependent zinc metalloprotease FtsH n=1 Tax=Benzoatithermus flavus TaxID=3108223 RepID=A0ABU8XM66_9PROT
MPELRRARFSLEKLTMWGLIAAVVLFVGLLVYGFVVRYLHPPLPAEPGFAASLWPNVERLSYSAFLDRVEHGAVRSVVLSGDTIEAKLADGHEIEVNAPQDPELIRELRAAKVDLQVAGGSISAGEVASSLLMLAILGLMIYQLVAGRSQQQLAQRTDLARSRAQRVNGERVGVRFSDVAGIDEVRDQVEEIAAFLRDPQRFKAFGARIPKGVLLSGPPGCGKTLLARAIAGEAHVPFFSASAAEFVEMFVGVGAARVRDLFKRARAQAPAIVFIDEIDAIGRRRAAIGGSGNDEREQTLNQILVEMDGFDGKDGVIVIAATNRPDILDPALTRPGRFDRKITVPMPDVRGREQILRVHAGSLPLAPEVDLSRIARATPGFSGADLANVMNEAALAAARAGRREVLPEDLYRAIDLQMMGVARPSLALSEQERRLTAYHEAGHALVAAMLPDSDPIHKATIVPHGGALGMVVRLPENDRVSVSRRKLEADLVVAMAGRAAEALIFGEDAVTAGAAGDIDQATRIVRKMITEWGMDDELGMVRLTEADPRTGEPIALGEATRRRIDERVKTRIDEAYRQALACLTAARDQLEALAQSLLERETLTGEEVRAIVLARTAMDREAFRQA